MARYKHNLERLMMRVLLEKQGEGPLSLNEIVTEIRRLIPDALPGKSPSKSLYSTIYRREKRRKERGLTPAFISHKRDLVARYSVNPDFNPEEAGKKI